MDSPSVSFIVPCYNLSLYLPDCLDSILSQSYSDFEVLIMDDCSPDNTGEVCDSYKDPRVIYIRNESNLGALRNYNRGITLSRGKYIWLISADDYLRRPHVLERYVGLMENDSTIGYIFCSGVAVRNGEETGVLGYSKFDDYDRIINGRSFLDSILRDSFILAPSAMVRRECYEKLSLFPLDVVWAGDPIDFIWGGDWYLWCLFALHYKVAYLAEPMVCYREHDLSSTDLVTKRQIDNCIRADLAIPWMIKMKADQAGLKRASRKCLLAAAHGYRRFLIGRLYRNGRVTIDYNQFEDSLCRNTTNEKERTFIRARAMAALADNFYYQENWSKVKEYYMASLRLDPWMARVYAKMLLFCFGKTGKHLRSWLSALRAY